MQHSKHQIFEQIILQVPNKLNLEETYFTELLPLLPSDDPASKQPVEVSATMLSRKPKISIKNRITHITLYLSALSSISSYSTRKVTGHNIKFGLILHYATSSPDGVIIGFSNGLNVNVKISDFFSDASHCCCCHVFCQLTG